MKDKARSYSLLSGRDKRGETAGERLMLRITINNHAPVTSFVLEGKLVGPWVKELEKCWESALATDPAKAMLVNLAAVTFIDSDGRELLARMRRQDVRLLSHGVLIDAMVAKIEAQEGHKTTECSDVN